MSKAAYYTPRVGARAELAEMILNGHLERAKEEGLTEDDLNTLITTGREAQQADLEQRMELADMHSSRTERSLKAEDIFAREEKLRNRMLAVIGDLQKSEPRLARWLSVLSFARFRFRELAGEARGAEQEGGEELTEEIKKVERVERQDIPTRLEGLANFCTALCQPGREPVVEAFAARGYSRELIEQLGDDARELARLGRNRMVAAAATEREAAAVRAQSERWSQVRRMIRAVALGPGAPPELKAKLADC